MLKRSRKQRLPDPNAMAVAIVEAITSETIIAKHIESSPKSEKNPAAVALGKLGGAKGGKARAQKLTHQERSRIAAKAASARWAKSAKTTKSSNATR